MSAYLWLSKLNVSPDTLCRCGHAAKEHLHGKSCAHEDPLTFKFCKCDTFKAASDSQVENLQGDEMSKKEKKVRKPKGEGRTPALAPFVDSSFKIYINHGGKEYEATVLSSGVIRYNDKEYTSPSSLGKRIVGIAINGWRAFTYNKDGERVMLNTLRGSKSPLKLEAPKPRKTKAAKSAKPNGAPKAKRVAKPRAKKAKPNGATRSDSSPDIRDSDIPQNEASA